MWLPDVEEHDFLAAQEYLSLSGSARGAVETVAALRCKPIRFFKAKDILRASGLELLPKRNAHVAKDVHKIKHKRPLSPILLVRGEPLVIADGYHRVCAVYHFDEDAEIACKIGARQ